MILPADLYDYADECPQRRTGSRGTAEDGVGVGRIAVVDDWPECIPVTEAEIDVFERYFGDVLDRLFDNSDPDHRNQGLNKLTSVVNDRP